jgi:hypothetical protein
MSWPTQICVHGTGTNQSTGQSFKALIPLIKTASFNPVAFDNVFAGVGPHLLNTDLKTYTGFLQLVGQQIKLESETASLLYPSQTKIPISYTGRSAGSMAGLFHLLLYDGVDNPYSVYNLISFSNPFYVDLQLERVNESFLKGTYASLDKRLLDKFLVLSKEAREFLILHKDQILKIGDNVTFYQGTRDEDGEVSKDKNALDALNDMVMTYLPRAHVYPLYDPLKNHPLIVEAFKRGILNDPGEFEASHFLISARSNMTVNQWNAIIEKIITTWKIKYPNEPLPDNPHVPISDLPALADQFMEIMASQWANLDYMIDSTSMEPAMLRNRENLRVYRLEFLKNSTEKTFFKWYLQSILKKYKYTDEDWENAVAGNRGLLSRFKKAELFWNTEKERVHALIKSQK